MARLPLRVIIILIAVLAISAGEGLALGASVSDLLSFYVGIAILAFIIYLIARAVLWAFHHPRRNTPPNHP